MKCARCLQEYNKHEMLTHRTHTLCPKCHKELTDKLAHPKCDRCLKEENNFTLSWFDGGFICNECEKEEQSHPLYSLAKEVALYNEQHGDTWYKGIGVPADLRQKHLLLDSN